jgi:WD repeat-containing protein 19
MALQRYEDAAKTAMVIAREEQNNGNYRVARDLLLKNHIALRDANHKIPLELETMLMILHSYLTVKVHFVLLILIKVTCESR